MASVVEFLQSVWSGFFVLVSRPGNMIFDVIDILVVAFVVYKALRFMHQTRAEQLTKGIIIFIAAYFAANILGLGAVRWIVSIISANILVVIVILFQPEIRSILERLGRGGFSNFSRSRGDDEKDLTNTVDVVCAAALKMQRSGTGALIVIERQTMLSEVAGTGTVIDADISESLIKNVFFKNSPLHDGAMIIRQNRVYAASCILPLTQSFDTDSVLGTRHRAAIGVSEISDAVTVVVSEESGRISLAIGGALTSDYNAETLKEKLLQELIQTKEPSDKNRLRKLFRKKGGERNEVSEED